LFFFFFFPSLPSSLPSHPQSLAPATSISNADNQGIISNILDEKVVQPLLVSTSALELATETVALILKIDDIQVSS